MAKNGNGSTWLKAWRISMASLMVGAIFAAWQASREFGTLSEAVNGLKSSVEKIDARVLYLERTKWEGFR